MADNAPNTAGLFGWFAGNSVSANLLMVFLIAGGLYAAVSMNAQTFPDIDPRQITVSVPYPGATPEEIETAVTRRVEEALIGIEGVERVRSVAAEGSGSVTAELKDFANAQTVRNEIETAVDRLAEFPPEEAERATITIAEATSTVMQLALFGPLSEPELRAAAERVESDLLQLPNVNLIQLQGVREREISINVSEAALRQYGLSFDQVAGAVRAASLDLSGGSLRTNGGEILLRTNAERRTGAAFEDIIVRSDASGRRLFLSDIATITDGFEDDELINTFRGQPTVNIAIGRADDQDAFDVSEAVLGFLAGYAAPHGVTIEVVSNQTTAISERLNLLTRNALMGLILVFLFLTFTLDLRLAFWTTVGIPVAFLGSFIIISQFVTISMPMLFGLIVVLGIVVDDAIVVGESIYDAQQRSSSGMAGAVSGTLGVMAPVTIGVLTTMAALAPLLFSTGVIGQLLFPVPVVVIAVLAMSLAEVFFILPAHMAHAGDWSVGVMAKLRGIGQGALAAFRDRVVLPVVIAATRMRYLTIAIGLMMLVTTFTAVSLGAVRFIFFPSVEADQITVNLEMREGAPFARTEAAMARISDAAIEAVGGEDSPLYESLSTTIGGQLGSVGGPGGGARGARGANLAEATLTLAPAAERELSSEEIARLWSTAVGEIPGVKSLSFSASLVGAGADISLDLTHADEGKLAAAVNELTAVLRGIPGVTEVTADLENGKRELEFELTDAGIAAGLTTQDIARQVRQSFFGEEVQRIQRGREEVRVYVRYPAEERRSLTDLERLRIRLAGGGEAPLGVVADMTESISPSSITRVDGRRIVTLEANVEEAFTTPGEVNALLANEILPSWTANDPQLRYSFEGSSRSQAEDLGALSSNLLISLCIIYVLLASVLRSYSMPLIIMAAIPFGAMSAVWGHILMGYDLSFLSLFGVVALTGVIINDSVVLLDYYNKVRASEGLTPYNGIIKAVRRRFRPILLTTLTTFLGLSPMLAETSLQARFLIPMAISLGFGILFAGFMILALVPCLIVIGDDLKTAPKLFLRLRRARVGH